MHNSGGMRALDDETTGARGWRNGPAQEGSLDGASARLGLSARTAAQSAPARQVTPCCSDDRMPTRCPAVWPAVPVCLLADEHLPERLMLRATLLADHACCSCRCSGTAGSPRHALGFSAICADASAQ